MKQHQYQNYNEYKSHQVAGNKNKLKYVYAEQASITMLASYLKKQMPVITKGLCHGTRRGMEQKWFREILNADVIGTEISPTAIQFPYTIQWDFHETKEEWLDNIDFIYSNSFDHSYDPVMCLDRWMSCIKKPFGMCIIEWSLKHSDQYVDSLDCFGASREEYQTFFEQKYQVKEVLTQKQTRHGDLHFFIIQHKVIQ